MDNSRAFGLFAPISVLLCVVGSSAPAVCAEGLTDEQRLVVACFNADINDVVNILRKGANVNSTFGRGDKWLLRDPWSLGVSAYTNDWTPLFAVSMSSIYPPPDREIPNTIEGIKWAVDHKRDVPAAEIQNRLRDQLVIAYILLSHNCDLNLGEQNGRTPLYAAIEAKKFDLAALLINQGCNVNTKAGGQIDGPEEITPLHEAFWSPALTKLLLEHGADPNAKDTDGHTPSDWVRRLRDSR